MSLESLAPVAGVVAGVLYLALAGFQLALALGAPWGRLAWGGQERVLSARRRGASVLAIAIYTIIAVIELDEGPRMMSNILDCPQTPEALVLDMKLEVAFETIDDKITLPQFRPAKG